MQRTDKLLTTLLGLILLTGTASLSGQSNVVMFDAEGTRMGVLNSVAGASFEYIVVETQDGFLMRIDSESGQVFLYNSDLFYESADCTGQAYLRYLGSESGLPTTGGQIVMHGFSSEAFFAKVGWTPVGNTILPNSLEGPGSGGCSDAAGVNPQSIPADKVDPADYGIKLRGDSTWGFVLPFHSVPVESDIFYCDGFESCPAE